MQNQQAQSKNEFQLRFKQKINQKINQFPQYSVQNSENQPFVQSCFKSALHQTIYSTNNLLVEFSQNDGVAKNIFLPSFLTINLKSITSLDLQNLSAQASIKIFFKIFYDRLLEPFHKSSENSEENKNMKQPLQQGNKSLSKPQQMSINPFNRVKQNQQIINILKNNIILNFVRDDPIVLTEQDNDQDQYHLKLNHNEEQKFIQFSIQKVFCLQLDSQVFWSPFQIINCIFEVTVQPLTIQTSVFSQFNMKEKVKVHFNLMDHQYVNQKISFTNWTTFGNYDLAQRKLSAIYTNYRVSKAEMFNMSCEKRIEKLRQNKSEQVKNQTTFFQNIKQNIFKCSQSIRQCIYGPKFKLPLQESSNPQSFHYAYFLIPLYKFPFSSLATIFLPLWLLAIVNLGIFFDEEKLATRIACIAAIMLAFVQLIPTIRSQIPPVSGILFVQIMVYFQSTTTLLAFFDSLNVRDTKDYSLQWIESGFYISSIVITILSFLIVVGMFIVHKCIWQPNYNLEYTRVNRIGKRRHWHNLQCDLYFKEKFNFMKRGKNQNFFKLKIKQLNDNKETKMVSYNITEEKNSKNGFYVPNTTRLQRILESIQMLDNNKIVSEGSQIISGRTDYVNGFLGQNRQMQLQTVKKLLKSNDFQ